MTLVCRFTNTSGFLLYKHIYKIKSIFGKSFFSIMSETINKCNYCERYNVTLRFYALSCINYNQRSYAADKLELLKILKTHEARLTIPCEIRLHQSNSNNCSDVIDYLPGSGSIDEELWSFSVSKNPQYFLDSNDLDHSFIPEDLENAFTHKTKTRTLKTKIINELQHLKSKRLYNRDELNKILKSFKRLSGLSSVRKSFILNIVKEEIDRRQNNFNCELKSYINVCIHSGLIKKATFAIIGSEYMRKKTNTKKKLAFKDYSLTDISVYETLFHALAKKNDIENIKNVYQTLLQSNHNVKITLQVYCGILECYGRILKNNDKNMFKDDIQNLFKDLNDKGFNLKNIVSDCKFQLDELDFILMAIRSILPTFSPEFINAQNLLDNKNYNVPLLKDVSLKKKCINPHHTIFKTMDFKKLINEQLRIELDSNVNIPSINFEKHENDQSQSARNQLDDLKSDWKNIMKKSFKRASKQLWELHKGDYKPNLIPYLKLFPVDTYVDLMIQEIDLISSFNGYSPNIPQLQRIIGLKLFEKYQARVKTENGTVDNIMGAYKLYCKKLKSKTLNSISFSRLWDESFLEYCGNIPLRDDNFKWPEHITRQIGKFLYAIIFADVRVNANMFRTDIDAKQDIPAFYTVQVQKPGEPYFKEEIRPHPIVLRLYQKANFSEMIFSSKDMPMLSPPIPWTNFNSGITFLSTTDLVKNSWASPTHQHLLQRTPSNSFLAVLDSINAVSATPWKINKVMLDIIINLFNKGGDSSLNVPPPANTCPQPPEIPINASPSERHIIIKERHLLQQKRNDMHGLWCTELYRLSIANKFRDRIFYFPHNLDFRSRAYAIPPHFNHLGGDLARSILCFANGKKLGENGLNWLKIHLINLTGIKKRFSNSERLEYANKILDDILDSARNPFEGKKWWMKSDEPWQTLACCIEISNVLNYHDPNSFISFFPVHQDGSCNGLQHYAALGRDSAGATSVNLTKSLKPNDVYSDVLELVETERKQDAANNLYIAKILENFVIRKVIKQTVMTTVYGVTWYGAWHQIMRQLSDIPTFPQAESKKAAQYLATKTLLCIQKMFSGTKRIQDWLTNSSDVITIIGNKPVKWTTPLGWPVIQPYVKPIKMPENLIKKYSHGLRLYHLEKPDAMKQKNAYPPNFIHSLDSTHMMLTAMKCLQNGITFVSVHDCFWTHPSDVETMNTICRQEFVRLHSYGILENLSMEMTNSCSSVGFKVECSSMFEMFAQSVLSTVPEKGDFKLEHVLKSEFFFS